MNVTGYKYKTKSTEKECWKVGEGALEIIFVLIYLLEKRRPLKERVKGGKVENSRNT